MRRDAPAPRCRGVLVPGGGGLPGIPGMASFVSSGIWAHISPPRLPHRGRAARLKAVLDRCPELQAPPPARSARSPPCSPQRTGQDLPQWISGARAAGLPGFSSFADGLEQDLDAVTAGLTTRWNSGPVEGRVNHIKMIKRQMFGRAGLPLLLRKRVLLTARN